MKSEEPLDPRLKRETLGLEGPPARVKRESRNLRLKYELKEHDITNVILKVANRPITWLVCAYSSIHS